MCLGFSYLQIEKLANCFSCFLIDMKFISKILKTNMGVFIISQCPSPQKMNKIHTRAVKKLETEHNNRKRTFTNCEIPKFSKFTISQFHFQILNFTQSKIDKSRKQQNFDTYTFTNFQTYRLPASQTYYLQTCFHIFLLCLKYF